MKFFKYNWGYLLGVLFAIAWSLTGGVLRTLCWIAGVGTLFAVSFYNRKRTESKNGRVIYTVLTCAYGWMLLCSPLLLIAELMADRL